jgi:hypothetical protein
VLEALEERHLVDDIVEQLRDTPFEDEHWSAKFKVTKENVEHHIEAGTDAGRDAPARSSESLKGSRPRPHAAGASRTYGDVASSVENGAPTGLIE